MATRLWQFLTTDIRELRLAEATEATKTGVDAAKAVFDLAKALKEQEPLRIPCSTPLRDATGRGIRAKTIIEPKNVCRMPRPYRYR